MKLNNITNNAKWFIVYLFDTTIFKLYKKNELDKMNYDLLIEEVKLANNQIINNNKNNFILILSSYSIISICIIFLYNNAPWLILITIVFYLVIIQIIRNKYKEESVKLKNYVNKINKVIKNNF